MPPTGQGWPPQENPPGYHAPWYPPPGYSPPGYPPPGYPPPGYGPPPGYPPQPPMALKPGVIPLRPLNLGDIFNGAFGYIRANPKPTLGLTAIVVIITQVLALILQVGPLAALSKVDPTTDTTGDGAALAGYIGASAVGAIIQGLATVVLSGMLTVVVGRAVFGSTITIGEAWRRIRDRIVPLIGLTVLLGLVVVIAVAALALVVVTVGATAGAGAAAVVAILLGLPLLAALIWFGIMVLFAPVALVLERQPVMASISRSFALVRGNFWRVLGIRLLAGIVTVAIAGAAAFPFGIAQVILGGISGGSTSAVVLGAVLSSIGAIIGQIITTPFSAGVVALLYTDRRIRAEAFDLVLRTGATAGPAYPASTDDLWLTRH